MPHALLALGLQSRGLAADGLSELETTPRAEQPATPELVGQKPLAPDPEIPSFRVVLRSNEAIVSRSVEGDANTEYHHSLGTITDTAIDLRNQETPQVLVSSASQLHLLALRMRRPAHQRRVWAESKNSVKRSFSRASTGLDPSVTSPVTAMPALRS